MGITRGWPLRLAALTALVVAAGLGAASRVTAAPPAAGDDLYVPPPDHGATMQIAALTAAGDKESADLVRAMIDTPQASGSPRARPARYATTSR